jgi:hypothetical protein
MEKTYDIAITTQENLDSCANPKMSSITGVFQKSLNVTSGDYQSYCLIIKSSTVLSDMDITINLEVIEDESEPTPTQHQIAEMDTVHEKMNQAIQERENGNKKIKYIIGALIILVGGFFLYHFWKSKNMTSSVSSNSQPLAPLADSLPVPVDISVPELPIPTPKIMERSTFSFY